jgi:hypothetical protein
LAAVLTAGLAACGGGGGGSDDVDLRAAYDRINRACMTISDVEKAVGVPPTSAPNDGNRIWTSGDQRLQVQFTPLDSLIVAGAVTWDLIPGQQLTKGFGIQECE